MRLLVMVLLLISTVAAADPAQWVGDVSLSAGVEHWSDWLLSNASTGSTGLTPDFQFHALLSLDGGIKISHELALIAHGSVTSPRYLYQYAFCDDPIPGEIQANSPFRYVAIEAGLGVEYQPTDGVWVSPWIGMLKLVLLGHVASLSQDAEPVYGLTGGFDVASDDAGNHLSIVANVSYSRLRTGSKYSEEDSSYLDLTAGLAYRFW
ncbi:MAG: hypothetical protein ABJE66_18715 [Deltaproteobacteria bacterium]